MSQTSMFWATNGLGDGPSAGYDRDDFVLFLGRLYQPEPAAYTTGGVLYTPLAATGMLATIFIVANTITIDTGAAIVAGFFYYNDSEEELTISIPLATTGGHVVLRCDYVAQTVRLVAVRNTSGNVAIPALVQVPGVTWEIRLCSFQITNGGVVTPTDTRSYIYLPTKIASGQIDDLAITEAKLAALSVSYTKAGAGTAILPFRKGGSSSNWHTAGTTDYTLTLPAKMQAGATNVATVAAATTASLAVVLPAALPNIPIAFIQTTTDNVIAYPTALATTGFTINLRCVNGATFSGANVLVFWNAVGS